MMSRHFLFGVASAALAAALFVSGACGQTVIQAGPATAGHLPQYFNQGTSQAIVGDGGGAGGGVINANPGEIGITSRGSGIYPVRGGGSGPNGEHFCAYDAPITTPGGYHALCFDPNSPLDNGAIISYNAFGGAPQQPFDLYVNGTLVPLSGLISTITLGQTQVVNGAAFSLLADSSGLLGQLIPGSGVGPALATQVNTTGGFAQYPVAAATLTGTLPVANGGTGQTTFINNAPVVGSGGSAALRSGSASGNTTQFATVSGTIPVTGNCAAWNAGNLIDAGAACGGGGGGGSGTVSAGSVNQLAFYGGSGTVVSGLSRIVFTQGGLPCDTLENRGGSTSSSAATNTSAFASVVAALPAAGGCLQLGTGTYAFANTSVTIPVGTSFSVYGTGNTSTVLSLPSATGGGGLTFLLGDASSSASGQDFAMLANDTTGGSNAINLQMISASGALKKSVFKNISMLGNGGGFFAWGYAINNVAGAEIDNPTINGFGTVAPAGSGILCQGATPGPAAGYTTGLTVLNPLIVGTPVGVQMGNFCQDLTVINPNISGGGIGVSTPGGATGALTELKVLGGVIAQETGSDVKLVSSVDSVVVQGMTVAPALGQNGIDIGPAVRGTVSGNTVFCASTNTTSGIATSGAHIAITGNVLNGCNIGVTVLTPASNINTQSNVYANNTNISVSNSPTANRWGSCVGVSGACTAGATP